MWPVMPVKYVSSVNKKVQFEKMPLYKEESNFSESEGEEDEKEEEEELEKPKEENMELVEKEENLKDISDSLALTNTRKNEIENKLPLKKSIGFYYIYENNVNSTIISEDVDVIIYGYFPINDSGRVCYGKEHKNIKSTIETSDKTPFMSVGLPRYIYKNENQTLFKSLDDQEGLKNKLNIKNIWMKLLSNEDKSCDEFIKSCSAVIEVLKFKGVDINIINSQIDENVLHFISRVKRGLPSDVKITITVDGDVVMNSNNFIKVFELVDYVNILTCFIGYNNHKKLTKHVLSINKLRSLLTEHDDFTDTIKNKINVIIPWYVRGYVISPEDFENISLNSSLENIQHPIKTPSIAGNPFILINQCDLSGTENVYVEDEGSWLIDNDRHEIYSYVDEKSFKIINDLLLKHGVHGIISYPINYQTQ